MKKIHEMNNPPILVYVGQNGNRLIACQNTEHANRTGKKPYISLESVEKHVQDTYIEKAKYNELKEQELYLKECLQKIETFISSLNLKEL